MVPDGYLSEDEGVEDGVVRDFLDKTVSDPEKMKRLHQEAKV